MMMISILNRKRNRATATSLNVVTAVVCAAALAIPIAVLEAQETGTGNQTEGAPQLPQEKTEANADDTSSDKARHYVRIVTDGTTLTYEGKPVSWGDLPTLLAKVSNRPNTVLELAIANDDVRVRHLNELQQKGQALAVQAGFEYSSYIGIHPMASAGSAPQPRLRPNEPAESLSGRDRQEAVRRASRFARPWPKWEKSEIVSLEKKLAQDPEDIMSRTILIGYYSRPYSDDAARKRHADLILWLIEHHPTSPVLATSYVQIDRHSTPGAYERGKKLFLQHLAAEKEDVNLLENAAKYFVFSDRNLGVESLEKASAIEPRNPIWQERLGFQYKLMQMSTMSNDLQREFSRKALDYYEHAYELGSDRKKQQLLGHLPKSAFTAGDYDKARHYAQAALSRGDKGDHFIGHMILGRVALADGDVKAAKEHLQQSAQIKGPPVPGSGPNMSLAKDLIEQGETETVLIFFKACEVFWNSPQLDKWSATVKENRMPNFGTNLLY